MEGGFFERSVNSQSQRSVNKLRNRDTQPLKPGRGESGGDRTPTEKIQVASTESAINTISLLEEEKQLICDRLIG